MKKLYSLLIVMMLILSGCTEEALAPKGISVQDAACPYEIVPENPELKITLRNGELNDISWIAEIVPQEICTVSSGKDGEYRIAGSQEGAAQVTFTAKKDETIQFVLTVVVNVDAKKQVTLTTYEHRQREVISTEADGLHYNWNVDVDGILTFSFLNTEDNWSVHGDGEGICTLLSKMSTPSGCKFTAQAAEAGQTVISLVGETTQRTLDVTICCDESGALEVLSVQER